MRWMACPEKTSLPVSCSCPDQAVLRLRVGWRAWQWTSRCWGQSSKGLDGGPTGLRLLYHHVIIYEILEMTVESMLWYLLEIDWNLTLPGSSWKDSRWASWGHGQKCWSRSGKIWSSRCAGDSCRLCSSARLGGIQPHISCWNSFPVEVAGAPEEETNAINLLDPYRPFNLDFRWLQPV